MNANIFICLIFFFSTINYFKDQNYFESMVGERAYFEPNWIPGFRQADCAIYVLKLTTENGIEG